MFSFIENWGSLKQDSFSEAALTTDLFATFMRDFLVKPSSLLGTFLRIPVPWFLIFLRLWKKVQQQSLYEVIEDIPLFFI